MREIELLKKINQSYCCLELKYYKLIIAMFLMVLTVFLEMAGLSILYPLMLVLGQTGEAHDRLFSIFPDSYSANSIALSLFASVVVLYVAKNIAIYFAYGYNINFTNYYHRNLISRLYSVYIYKPLMEFQKESAGSLSSIICDQSTRLVQEIVRPLLVMITEFSLLLCISSLIFFINPLLTLSIIVVCGSAAALFYYLTRSRALSWGRTRTDAVTMLHELVNNTSRGISEIKIFNKENYMIKKLNETAFVETKMFHHLDLFQQVPRWLLETVFIVTMVVFFSIQLVMGANLPLLMAQFSVIGAASFRILPCMNRLVNSYSSFSFYIGPALTLLDTVLSKDLLSLSSLNEIGDGKSREFSAEQIEFKDISFKYPFSHDSIIKHLNLTILRGQRVGIVGFSGSGKSTFIKILAGLYIPDSGSMLVDGQQITNELKSWQRIIGYVPQDSFIMPATIRENIAFESNDQVADAEIWDVLDKVGLARFVRLLPEGLDTEIGEKRISLSGGQKQLICLARALFRHPSILLLDEPTASLDIHNEQIVLEAINSLPSDVTVVMASHKSQNFENFDHIYIFENGQIFRNEQKAALSANV